MGTLHQDIHAGTSERKEAKLATVFVLYLPSLTVLVPGVLAGIDGVGLSCSDGGSALADQYLTGVCSPPHQISTGLTVDRIELFPGTTRRRRRHSSILSVGLIAIWSSVRGEGGGYTHTTRGTWIRDRDKFDQYLTSI